MFIVIQTMHGQIPIRLNQINSAQVNIFMLQKYKNTKTY